jgi:hypothetical protein
MSHTFSFWHRVASEPWLLWSFTVALSGIVTLITLGAEWLPQLLRSRRPRKGDTPTPAPARVRTLAERGMTIGDIARRTGVSHDAVATIMRASMSMPAIPDPEARQSRPGSARTSAR